MGNRLTRAAAALCAGCLACALMPAAALGTPSDGGEAPAAALPASLTSDGAPRSLARPALGGTAGDAPDGALGALSVTVVDRETSAQALSTLLSPRADDPDVLADGAHVTYLDRLAAPSYARDLYDVLVEATDGDGEADYLIEDRFFDAAALPALQPGAPAEPCAHDGAALIPVVTLPGAAPLPDDERAAVVDEARYLVLAALAAFDRDHPEVFWLGGAAAVGEVEAGDDLVLAMVLAADGFDARAEAYRGQGIIGSAIAQREADVQAALAALRADGADASASESVRFLNRWLVERNAVNDDPAPSVADYPAAWECVSALAGRSGAEGPVAEGYARALKVLCDRLGIPCVLADGMAAPAAGEGAPGPHMWNLVQVEGAWYAVDVARNDAPGAPDTAFDPAVNEAFLLVGASTEVGGQAFSASHPARNRVLAQGPSFVNGPVLSDQAYLPKAAPVVAAPTGLAAVYGDALESVALPDAGPGETPGRWRWAGPAQAVGDAGTRTFRAVFTPDDDAYAPVAADVAVEVARRPVTPEVRLEASRYTWAGAPVEPAVTAWVGDAAIPASEYTVSFEGNDALGTATAHIADAPGGNYAVGEAAASFELVERATPVLRVTDVEKVYDGQPVDAAAVLEGAVATVEGREVGGTWSVEADAPLVAAGVYEAVVRFEPDDDALLSAQATARVTIARRPLTLSVRPASNRLTASDAVEAPVLVAQGLVEGEELQPAIGAVLHGMPARGQVGEHVVTWANAEAVLTAVNALPVAANYDVALADDLGFMLTIADVALSPVDDGRYRVELTRGLDAAPAGLAVTPYQTPEAVEAELARAAQTALPTTRPDRVDVYDAALFVDDGDGAWSEADASALPAEGLVVTLPLPEGADPQAHAFTAAHMFTASAGGHEPGEVESCEATASAEGVRVTVHGLSPVAVAWGEVPTADATPLSQTGDRLAPYALALVTVLSVALVAVVSRRRFRA
ncbi:MAG: hypothetical protein HFJ75_02915 [Eggerthellaceae bacterium]|nr:hypothetical protein [Eggerthellaceae bacterium]